jgi:hypothetical protein
MGRLFKTHPLTVFRAVKSDQGVLDIGDRSYDKLARVAFSPIGPESGSVEHSFGAATFENYRSTNFGPANTEFDEYIVFSLRADERKVPAAALNKEFEDAVDAELERNRDQGKNFVSRERKKEIKEQVKLRMLAHMPPVPKVVDVIWNTKTDLVFVTDKSKTALTRVENVFNAAFGPEYTLAPFELCDMLPMVEDIASRSEFVRGFLTWLWKERASGNDYHVYDTNFVAYIEDKITIADAHESIAASVSGEAEGEFMEIIQGVQSGKQVVQAGVSFERYVDEGVEKLAYMDLLGESLPSINSVTIPPVTHLDAEDVAGAMLIQIGNIEEAFGMLQHLIVHYVEQVGHDFGSFQSLRECLLGLAQEGTSVTVSCGDDSVTIKRKAA